MEVLLMYRTNINNVCLKFTEILLIYTTYYEILLLACIQVGLFYIIWLEKLLYSYEYLIIVGYNLDQGVSKVRPVGRIRPRHGPWCSSRKHETHA